MVLRQNLQEQREMISQRKISHFGTSCCIRSGKNVFRLTFFITMQGSFTHSNVMTFRRVFFFPLEEKALRNMML